MRGGFGQAARREALGDAVAQHFQRSNDVALVERVQFAQKVTSVFFCITKCGPNREGPGA